MLPLNYSGSIVNLIVTVDNVGEEHFFKGPLSTEVFSMMGQEIFYQDLYIQFDVALDQ
jgi:hypothetical protein